MHYFTNYDHNILQLWLKCRWDMWMLRLVPFTSIPTTQANFSIIIMPLSSTTLTSSLTTRVWTVRVDSPPQSTESTSLISGLTLLLGASLVPTLQRRLVLPSSRILGLNCHGTMQTQITLYRPLWPCRR